MKILIDIGHPAHLNFFKYVIQYLKQNGNTVFITALRRGKLPVIIKNEISDIPTNFNGKHRGTKFSIIFEANLLRFYEQLKFVYRKNFDIAISVGSFTTGFIFKYILNKPNIQIDDDPERKLNVILEKITSSELYFPPIIKERKNIKTFNALKEWAYLSPKYFKPNENILQKYGILKKRYIFIREISTASLNYRKQEQGIIARIANRLSSKYRVIFSLEYKKLRNIYPDDWIELNEPVDNIHSLMYYSKYIISSGDSMAREGAMLGVPSIYCGRREMRANELLIDKGILFQKCPEEVPDFINKLDNKIQQVPEQNSFREKLMNEWTDVTQFLIDRINFYGENKK